MIEILPNEPKRLPFNESPCVSIYRIKPYLLRHILVNLEKKDLKNLAKFLGLKNGGSKKDIINRIWFSELIDSLGFITTKSND